MTARVVEWQAAKGFGFLQLGRQRIFLHRRDFTKWHRTPAIGDQISFILGSDAQGRTCATSAVNLSRGGRTGLVALLFLAALLALPVCALHKWQVNWRWVGGLVLLMNTLTFLAYLTDKHRAENDQWRIPESNLQLLALLGGWPAAFLAQCQLRHKCSKTAFQIQFWFIVLLHQFLALDSLLGWRLSRAMGEIMRRLVKD